MSGILPGTIHLTILSIWETLSNKKNKKNSNMNTALQAMPTYLSKYISDRVSNDGSIINLSIGEPFFLPPEEVYDQLKADLFSGGYDTIPNKYADSRGSRKLRAEIAQRYTRLYNATVDPETEVLVTHGAAEAIWLCILTLTSAGDEVLIPDPSYTLYETAVRLLGRAPIKLPTSASDGSCLSIDAITSSITPRTKMLIVNSPENPTGAVYPQDKLKGIHELAVERGFYFVHDEVYDSFIFDGQHENYLRLHEKIDDNSILINSFSKRFSMMGWRLGWIIGGKKIIDNATKVHTNLTLNLGVLHQDAAASVLNNQEVEKSLRKHVEQIKDNMNLLGSSLASVSEINLINGVPKAGFFLFPDISDLYEVIPAKYKNYSTKGEGVMEYLLEEHRVAVVPGYIYGKAGSNCIRIVAAVAHKAAKEAASRLAGVNTLVKI
jgi:aspartate/methionine/tyrosine aminotransferase